MGDQTTRSWVNEARVDGRTQGIPPHFRDYRTLAIIIVLPVFLLILLGYGVSGESKDISIAVADLSKSDASRRYIEYFTASGEFKVEYDAFTEDEIIDLLDREKVSAGLIIPEQFEEKLVAGETVVVQFYVNGSDPSIAQTTNLKLESIAQVASQRMLADKFSAAPTRLCYVRLKFRSKPHSGSFTTRIVRSKFT